MATFVLVHGAWHGAWCFSELVEALERRGHDVWAPTLPCEDVALTQHDYARLIGPQPDAVVVGHSLGGFTISLVETRVRVYLSALLPVPNVYRDAFAAGFGGTVGDELGRSYWPDGETAAARMYPDCEPERAAWAFARLRHQAPLVPHVAELAAGDVSIACLRDAAIDPAWQLRLGREHFERVFELDAGHSPFFTHVEKLVGLLELAAA